MENIMCRVEELLCPGEMTQAVSDGAYNDAIVPMFSYGDCLVVHLANPRRRTKFGAQRALHIALYLLISRKQRTKGQERTGEITSFARDVVWNIPVA